MAASFTSHNPFLAHFGGDLTSAPSDASHEALLRAVLDAPNGGMESTNFQRARAVIGSLLKRRCDVEKMEAASSTSTHVRGEPLLYPRPRRMRPRVVIAYTSNLISCGLREVFAYLAKHNLVDAFVSTAGGVEEDVIKCLGDTLVGDFALPGAALRDQGLNRVGNLLIPNDNYVSFEEFFVPVVERLHRKQLAAGFSSHTSPTELIYEMGLELGGKQARQYLFSPTLHYRLKRERQQGLDTARSQPTEEEEAERDACLDRSLVYWCSKNRIPLYCPALTDGSMGDMICFYEWRQKGFLVDPLADYGWLLPFGDDVKKEGPNIPVHDKAEEDDSEEEQELLVLCLGAGLPRNYALTMTPTTGTRFLKKYATLDSSTYDVDEGASALLYHPLEETDAATDLEKGPLGSSSMNTLSTETRMCRTNRTVVQIVTGTPTDACRSSADRGVDMDAGLVSEGDQYIRVQGDASFLFPLLLAGLLPTNN